LDKIQLSIPWLKQ